MTIIVETDCCVDKPTIEIPIQAGPPSLKGRPSSGPSPPDGFVEQASVSNLVQVSSSTAIVGGPEMVVMRDYEEEITAAGVGESRAPTVDVLIKNLSDSISDYDLVKERINDDDWKPIFATMTPTIYGKIIQQVSYNVFMDTTLH